jgi:hypothetical protein
MQLTAEDFARILHNLGTCWERNLVNAHATVIATLVAA